MCISLLALDCRKSRISCKAEMAQIIPGHKLAGPHKFNLCYNVANSWICGLFLLYSTQHEPMLEMQP